MSELKPCPFCGGMPKVNDWTLKGITDKRCFCDNEKCPVYLSKTVAIDDWNTRPIEDALNARIAELEANIEILKDQQREARNILIDKKLQIDSLYEAGYKLQQRWRVVANGELPEDGEVVWLWDGKYIGMGYYLVFAGQFMDRDTPLRRIKPTHWMPLPESPNDTQTQTIVYGKESEE